MNRRDTRARAASRTGLRSGILRSAGLAMVALLLAACPAESPRSALPVGAPIPRFELPWLDDGTLDSRSWRGRTIVLNLWATWCEPCRDEMPALERLANRLDTDRYQVVGIALDTDANLAREFLLQYGITFPVALDPDGKVVKQALGSWALPDTLVIAPDGTLADRVLGSAPWDSLGMRQRLLAVGSASVNPGSPPDGLARQ